MGYERHISRVVFSSSAYSLEVNDCFSACRSKAPPAAFTGDLRRRANSDLTPHYRRNRMSKKKQGVTRRRFLEQVGLAGGSAALYETMTALGLIHVPEVWAGPPELPQGSGSGKSVVILGAGIAGLTAAYELTRANYSCQVIELTERPGGRNHTARRGTVLKEVNQNGQTTEQVCN